MPQKYRENSLLYPDSHEIRHRKLIVSLGNAFVRLTARDRQKVIRILTQFTFGNANNIAYWVPWSKNELKRCNLQLIPISQKMANDLYRWGSELLKAGYNKRIALKRLLDELHYRRSIEKA